MIPAEVTAITEGYAVQSTTSSARQSRAGRLGIALLLGCAGCSSFSREGQLQAVAKDWCLTIRASQVLPVYPLTQDLQPGDVFLVQVPIEQQAATWKAKGYLPLDHHLARIDPTGYAGFYTPSFWPNSPALPSEQPAGRRFVYDAPLAAGFPSYSFSVRRSFGFAAALPIHGIPVGLGLLGSDAADGVVTIGKATTLGVDEASLYEDLLAWASTKGFLLSAYESGAERAAYVRVVSRIYLAGELKVSLHDAANRAAGADAGVAPSLTDALVRPPATGGETAAPTAEQAVANYERGLAALNRALATAAVKPGGTLRVAAATARSVVMSETFEPPLVVGYLGFDCRIGPGGLLGPPVPTLAVIEANAVPPLPRGYDVDLAVWTIYRIADSRRTSATAAATIARDLDALATLLPAKDTHYGPGPGGELVVQEWTLPAEPTYATFRAWRGKVRTSLAVLTRETAAETPRTPPGVDLAAEIGRLQRELEAPALEAAARSAEQAAMSGFFHLFRPR